MKHKFEVIPGGRDKDNEKNKKEINRRKFIKRAVGGSLAAITLAELYKKLEDKKEKIDKVQNASEAIYFVLTGEKRKFDFVYYRDYDFYLYKLNQEEKTNFPQERLIKKIKENFEEKNIKLKTEVKIFNNLEEGLNFINQNKDANTFIIILWPARVGSGGSFNTLSMGIITESQKDYFSVWDPNNGNLNYSIKEMPNFKNLSIWKKTNKPLILISISPKIAISKDLQMKAEEEIKKFKKNLQNKNN